MHPFAHNGGNDAKCHEFQIDDRRGRKNWFSFTLGVLAIATTFAVKSMTRFDISWIVLCSFWFSNSFFFFFISMPMQSAIAFVRSDVVLLVQLWFCYCCCGIALCNRQTVRFFSAANRHMHRVCLWGTSNRCMGARLAFVINKIIWSILIDSLSHSALCAVWI